ncbi:MAG: hypothetical protein ABIM49_03835 [candidate division WOR-3 bacterium]
MITKNIIENYSIPPEQEYAIYLYNFETQYSNFSFIFDTHLANSGKILIEFYTFIVENETIFLDTEPYYTKEIAKYSPSYQTSLILIPTPPKTCIKIKNKMNAEITIKKLIQHYEL